MTASSHPTTNLQNVKLPAIICSMSSCTECCKTWRIMRSWRESALTQMFKDGGSMDKRTSSATTINSLSGTMVDFNENMNSKEETSSLLFQGQGGERREKRCHYQMRQKCGTAECAATAAMTSLLTAIKLHS